MKKKIEYLNNDRKFWNKMGVNLFVESPCVVHINTFIDRSTRHSRTI